MSSIRDDIGEIASLQSLWTSKNTVDMQRRGLLVRRDGPAWLKELGGLASAIGIPSDDLICEGSDGTGQKTEIPWFRFASRDRSPNARTGWYCVYLFEAMGDTVSSSGAGLYRLDRKRFQTEANFGPVELL